MKTSLSTLALALAAATGGLALSNIAIAQPARPPMADMMFEKLDANKDGTVTRDEAKAAAEKHFEEMDGNRDGKLSADERKAAHAAMHDKMKAAMFDRIDANKDGQISRDEFMAFGPREKGGADDADGPDGPPHMGMTGRHHRMGMDHGPDKGGMMGNADVNKADFVARRLRMFDRVDANHDGKITSAERDDFMAKMHERRHGHHGAAAN